ncbi:hypothetical protein Q1695_011890 [Nippostrongylus brasiliensis]|nr:hypothetical protein Q1695_011890 [Nippostrongylus brasiliensis]
MDDGFLKMTVLRDGRALCCDGGVVRATIARSFFRRVWSEQRRSFVGAKTHASSVFHVASSSPCTTMKVSAFFDSYASVLGSSRHLMKEQSSLH